MFRLATLGTLLIASCVAQAPAEPVPVADSLTAPTWRAAEIAGSGVVDRVQSTVRFDVDGVVHGLAACNRFSGSYRRAGDTLRVGPLAATKMACAEAVMAQETRFLAVLEEVERFEVAEDGSLVLVPKGGGEPTRLVVVEAD
jgi:putative lipoprotein